MTDKFYHENFNVGPNSFMNQHIRLRAKDYPLGFENNNALAYHFASANTNSCGTRAMALMGGNNKKNRFHFLAALMHGGFWWGANVDDPHYGKQLILHVTDPMYKSWKAVFDQLGIKSVAQFQNSWGGKIIHLTPVTLSKPLSRLIREEIMAKEYPLFLSDWCFWTNNLSSDGPDSGYYRTNTWNAEWTKHIDLTETYKLKNEDKFCSFEGNGPDGAFPTVQVSDVA